MRGLSLGGWCGVVLSVAGWGATASAELPAKRALLERFDFWDNRDWDWYEANIPFVDTPDREIDATYYYRWEVVTKHLTYGSPRSGYSYTEFIDRPFWSGAYGAIACPAGHQLYEVRWLRDRRYAQDYARYWFRTPGAQPRNYSTWLADSVWAVQMAQNDPQLALDLLPDLVRNYEGWQARHYVPEVGLFWQTGHDDGMEFNINSRQTKDILRGAPSYRPSFNAYMYADATAIAQIAQLAGDEPLQERFAEEATRIKTLVEEKLWDPERSFFFPMFRDDEEKDGFVNKAGTLTYQTGQFAGSPHGRELIGYVPWQFNLPTSDQGFEQAWKFLRDRDYFWADFGPTVTERNDPLFLVTDHCCWWSGQSWPYATTQTLAALANVLNNYPQDVVTRDDYYQVLRTYSLTHRKDGRPYIAEAAHPDTGSWKGYDNYNHSEHYFHSAYCDLIVTGLMGLRPRADDVLEVNPLAPAEWDYFALIDAPYRGRLVSIVWDRDGTRYGLGAGLRLFADGQEIAASARLERVTAELPPAAPPAETAPRYNFAVNNDGTFYPRVTASSTGEGGSLMAAHDGNYWYHRSPPNRWVAGGQPGGSDWIAVDLGTPRLLDEITLYPLDDDDQVRPPAAVRLERWENDAWLPLEDAVCAQQPPAGRRANRWTFPPQRLQKFRVVLQHAPGARCGLSEIEAWGVAAKDQLDPPQPPPSLAANLDGAEFPQATASFTSRFDRIAQVNDGQISYRPNPHNRWTAYESPDAWDWLQIDFGQPRTFSRVELHLFDDRGGVQAPASYRVEVEGEDGWVEPAEVRRSPEKPQGGAMNTVTFAPVTSRKIRVVFEHAGAARTGVTEIEVWEK